MEDLAALLEVNSNYEYLKVSVEKLTILQNIISDVEGSVKNELFKEHLKIFLLSIQKEKNQFLIQLGTCEDKKEGSFEFPNLLKCIKGNTDNQLYINYAKFYDQYNIISKVMFDSYSTVENNSKNVLNINRNTCGSDIILSIKEVVVEAPDAPNVEEVKPVEEVNVEEVKVEDVQVEDVQVEEVKAEEVKVEDVQVEEVKAEEVKVEDVQVEDVQVKEVKAEEVKVEEVKAEEVKAEEVNVEEVNVEEVKVEEVNVEEVKVEEVNVEEVNVEEVNVEEVNVEEVNVEEVKVEEVKVEEVKVEEVNVEEVKVEEVNVEEVNVEEVKVEEVNVEEVNVEEPKVKLEIVAEDLENKNENINNMEYSPETVKAVRAELEENMKKIGDSCQKLEALETSKNEISECKKSLEEFKSKGMNVDSALAPLDAQYIEVVGKLNGFATSLDDVNKSLKTLLETMNN